MAEPTAPRILGGRYELDEVLGYGGMAEVYHGRDVRLGRDVAVKVLRSDLSRDPTFQARFRREAQSAASLNHPMIVSVYDTGQDDDDNPPLPYIVMEYVEGPTLRDLLHNEGGRLTPDRALEIVADVCAALEYSHRAGIVHRDIKPGNVMLARDGTVKVMDFGIARAMAASSATVTQTAAVMGTAQYLSPEQAQGDAVDARSDVYSTGCLLYELLTGVPPFTGDSAVALAYQHVREDAPPPSEVDPDLSPDIDAVVLKALAKNPDNRYQDAGEMRADLLRAIAGERVLATPLLREEPEPWRTRAIPVAPADPEPRRSRRPLAVLLGFLLLLGLLTGAGLLARNLLVGKQVVVPTVTGVQVADAQRKLEAAGLQLGAQTKRASPQTVGVVLEQSPAAGKKTSDDTVDVIVSSGPGTVGVPGDLHGKLQADAENELRDLQLVPKVETRTGSSLPAGQVDTVSPAAGTPVPAGSTVTLGVSAAAASVPVQQPTSATSVVPGPAPVPVPVPVVPSASSQAPAPAPVPVPTQAPVTTRPPAPATSAPVRVVPTASASAAPTP